MKKSFKVLLSIIFLVFITLFIIMVSGSKIYTDWLWFSNLGFSHTFLVMFISNFWIRIVIGILFTIFIFVNLLFTRSLFNRFINYKEDDRVESIFRMEREGFFNWLTTRRLTGIYFLISIILGFLFSSISQDVWKTVLRFVNQTPFGTTDPIFNLDIGFYVFSLPFFNFIRELGMVLVILTLIVIGLIYILASGVSSIDDMTLKLSNRAKTHMTILVVLFLFLKAWSYRLDMYNILYSTRGVVFGASYTDINANLIGLRILSIIAVVIGIILIISIFRKKYKLLIWGLGVWLLASFIFGSLYPGFIQKFQVEPNEIAKESKYINYNIEMTLQAYGLDQIETEPFNLKNDLTYNDLVKSRETIDNIKLWDSRPLLSTYSQLQELRQYYNFINVDIDRYMIDGEYRQVMLAAREMDQSLLSGQAQNWINQTLKYTHGFGLVMSPVNQVSSEGLPEFFIKDIPPKTNIDIELKNSSIYYGEKTNNYVIANTRSREFHYPLGSENVYINYDGDGGVRLSSFLQKAIYALRFGNIKLILSGDITEESRILYYRNIKDRVSRVAPFLSYDRDPYLVVSQGRLFWIQDAYTTTSRYPYSQPVSNLGNYIRNSIKIVVDAYNGSMKFYIIDKQDPLALTYQKIFPDLFVSGDEMTDDIRRHLRYPKDLFVIQSRLYSTYHMKNPTVFYNKEDLWNIPQENYAGTSIQMQPYYIISQLPGKEKPEFILMLPFTPATKNNMISWMAARSDGENYGKLHIYTLPKDQLIYGPMQIESRIDQDSQISQLLTLWGQRGSRVIRGNLLVIPVKNSILYVEPIYLQAETSELPELKRVVVAFGDRLVMTERLDQALAQIFGQEVEKHVVPDQLEELDLTGTFSKLAQQALDSYNQVIQSLQDLDFDRLGDQLRQLEEILERLNDNSAEEID